MFLIILIEIYILLNMKVCYGERFLNKIVYIYYYCANWILWGSSFSCTRIVEYIKDGQNYFKVQLIIK